MEITRKTYVVRKIPVEMEAFKWDGVCDGKMLEQVDAVWHKNCGLCGLENTRHGWLKYYYNYGPICPGDWIVKEKGKDRYHFIQAAVFEKTYEILEDKIKTEKLEPIDFSRRSVHKRPKPHGEPPISRENNDI